MVTILGLNGLNRNQHKKSWATRLPPSHSSVTRRGARQLAKEIFLDLACRGLGQRAEDDPLRGLIMREAVAAVRDQLGLCHLHAGLQFHEGAGRLAPYGIRLRHDRGGENRRVAMERILDLE